MTRALKLHWANSKPNFGDWLSPALCEHLSRRPVVHAKIGNADLVGMGSLLQRVHPRFWQRRDVQVWGSGFIAPQRPGPLRYRAAAVRGPHSAALITDQEVSVFGDPGLLVESVFGRSRERPVTLGIVPHYKDRAEPAVAELHRSIADSEIIDVFAPPAEVVARIRSCTFVISSSLHGLVVADAYGIPNAWMVVSGRQRGAGFKIRDYYAVFGIEDVAPLAPADRLPDLDAIVRHIGDYQRPGLESIKSALAASFPFLP